MSSSSIPSNITGIGAQMSGATNLQPGSSGSTSTPVAGDQTKFQSGGGGFTTPSLIGAGTPEGSIRGSVGNLYWDTTANVLYVKDTGANTITGWVAMATQGVWTTYTPLVTATLAGTNPTFPTGAIITGNYMIQGKTMFLNLKYLAAGIVGGADGTQSYQYSLPVGYTIDTAKAVIPSQLGNVSASGMNGGCIGSGFGRNNTAANAAGLMVVPLSTTTIGAYFEGATRLIGAGALAMTGAANTMISMTCQIPIL